jgi:hypothetical protein
LVQRCSTAAGGRPYALGGCERNALNVSRQTSKACEGKPSEGSNPSATAILTRANAGLRRGAHTGVLALVSFAPPAASEDLSSRGWRTTNSQSRSASTGPAPCCPGQDGRRPSRGTGSHAPTSSPSQRTLLRDHGRGPGQDRHRGPREHHMAPWAAGPGPLRIRVVRVGRDTGPAPGAPRFGVPRDHVAAASWIVHTNWRTSPDVPPGKRNAPSAGHGCNCQSLPSTRTAGIFLSVQRRRLRFCCLSGSGARLRTLVSACLRITLGGMICRSGELLA